MDALDCKALELLLQNGRATWAELGEHLGLSAPAAADRVHKLEERKVIRGYSALPDPESLGYGLLAFVFVTLRHHRQRKTFLRAIEKHVEILECHHITGDHDYLLKIRCHGTQELDHLLAVELKQKLGLAATRTTIALSTAKETFAVPVAS